MIRDRNYYLDVLNLEPGATQEEIQKAYHDLVKVWHPDRFGSDPDLALKAEEILKGINEAHAALMRIPENPRHYSPPATRPPQKEGMFHGSFFWFLVLVICSLFLFGLGWSSYHSAFYKSRPGKSLQEIA